jgi:hypothetical protein
LSSLDPTAPQLLTTLLEWWQGGLVLGGLALALLLVGAWTTWRRDVS